MSGLWEIKREGGADEMNTTERKEVNGGGDAFR